MAPPRSTRVMQDAAEAPPGEVLDAMRAYAEAYQVQPMLHILLTRLLEAQPLDPLEFLIKTVQNDPELDALELKSKIKRFDLRRERTKKTLVHAFYARLVALQRTQHDDHEAVSSHTLAKSFLLSQLTLEETRDHLKIHFPTHYRDLIQWFLVHDQELKDTIPLEAFIVACMTVLSDMAQV